MHDAVKDDTSAPWKVESIFCMQKEYSLRQRYACNFFDSPSIKVESNYPSLDMGEP